MSGLCRLLSASRIIDRQDLEGFMGVEHRDSKGFEL